MSIVAFGVPPAPDSCTFVRHAELESLHTHLALQRLVAVVGPGGQGKTELVRSYAVRHRASYRTVLWISGRGAHRFKLNLLSLAEPLEQAGCIPSAGLRPASGLRGSPELAQVDPALAEVHRYLAQASDYLLVIDDLQRSADSAWGMLWPAHLAGHVIVTSRQKDPPCIPKVLQLPPLSRGEAEAFLTTCFPSADPGDLAVLPHLARWLHGQPLALSLAGSRVTYLGQTYRQYLLEFFRQESALVPEQLLAAHPEAAALIPLLLAMESIGKESPAAADLLKLSAFLDAQGMPVEFLPYAHAALGPAFHSALGGLASVLTDWGPEMWLGLPRRKRHKEPRLPRVTAVLRNYGLLWSGPAAKELHFHRTVQQLLRLQLSEEEQRRWANGALQQLDAVLTGKSPNSELHRQLWPTQLAVLEAAKQLGLYGPSPLKVRQWVLAQRHDEHPTAPVRPPVALPPGELPWSLPTTARQEATAGRAALTQLLRTPPGLAPAPASLPKAVELTPEQPQPDLGELLLAGPTDSTEVYRRMHHIKELVPEALPDWLFTVLSGLT